MEKIKGIEMFISKKIKTLVSIGLLSLLLVGCGGSYINKDIGKMNNGKFTGEKNQYFVDGDNKTLVWQAIIKNGNKTKVSQWHENGQVAMIFNYVNGLKQGDVKAYEDNGELAYIHTFDKDKKVFLKYFSEGKLDASRKYIKPYTEKNFLETRYYNKGSKVETTYVNYIANGKETWYYSNGKVKETRNYKNGLLVDYPKQFTKYGQAKKLDALTYAAYTNINTQKFVALRYVFKEDQTKRADTALY